MLEVGCERWEVGYKGLPLKQLKIIPISHLSHPETRVWRNGRRAGIRLQCPRGRGGSTPFTRTLEVGSGKLDVGVEALPSKKPQ